MLYKATEDYLWEHGCTAQTAFVKDDNVASWKLFLNNGFSQISFTEGAKNLGLKTMLYFYFETAFFAATGMECYRIGPKYTGIAYSENFIDNEELEFASILTISNLELWLDSFDIDGFKSVLRLYGYAIGQQKVVYIKEETKI